MAVLIRKGIKFKSVYSKEIYRFKTVEACMICIPLRSDRRLYVGAIYAPKTAETSQQPSAIDEIDTIFRTLQLDSNSNYFILAGDFNARHAAWNNNVSNTRGTLLYDWWVSNRLQRRVALLATDSPSFPSHGSYLDLALVDSRFELARTNETAVNCVRTVYYDSDHNGLLLTGQVPNDEFQLVEYAQSGDYMYSKADWARFTKAMHRAVLRNIQIPTNRNLTNTEVDQYLKDMDDLTRQTMDKTIPRTKPGCSLECYRNRTIDALYTEKSRLLTEYKNLQRRYADRQSPRAVSLKSQLKVLQQLIKLNYIKSINKYWNNKIQAINASSPSMFPNIKQIFRRRDKNQIESLCIPRTRQSEQYIVEVGLDPDEVTLDANTFLVEEEQARVDVMGAFYQSVYSLNTSARPDRDLENRALLSHFRLLNEIETWNSQNRSVTKFSANNPADDVKDETTRSVFVGREELVLLFRETNSKKSSGVDGIPNIVLRNMPQVVTDIYTVLFNNLLNNAHYPAHWKTAMVYPIPKKDKDRANPSNLRAISLLPNISKVFERVVHKSILAWTEEKQIIPDRQFGFKARHNTIHAASKLVSDIQWNRSKGQCTGACLVDFEKAFDTVWLEGLIHKLITYGMSGHLLYTIYNMITEKKFLVKSGNLTSSRTFQIKNGLQQGAVLSPLLFNIYTSDLVSSLRHAIAYADDLVAYRTGPKVEVIQRLLQRDFENIENYSNKWKMKINFSKCEVILFRVPTHKANRDTKDNWKKLHLKSQTGQTLQQKTVVKYLGIWLDNCLVFNHQVDKLLEKANKAFQMTRRLFYSKHLDPRVKIICYQSLVRPILTYGCPVWFNIGPLYMERIRLFERQCIRACLSKYRTPQSEYQRYYSNKVIYELAGLNRIDNFIIKLIRGHVLRDLDNENNLISGAYYPNQLYHERSKANGFIPPEAFMYLDSEGMIQNMLGVPILYHIHRGTRQKAITHSADTYSTEMIRFSTRVPQRDKEEALKAPSYFWWLKQN